MQMYEIHWISILFYYFILLFYFITILFYLGIIFCKYFTYAWK